MNYDLRNKDERKKFLIYANRLMKDQKTNVCLIDESNRTLNQNSYIHVLCRILAEDTGVTEEYAKQVYFKELANPEIFVTTTKDAITGKLIRITRSTTELTTPEMSKAIKRFILWATENGYVLPEADVNALGEMTFKDQQNEDAFHQALIKTSKNENL